MTITPLSDEFSQLLETLGTVPLLQLLLSTYSVLTENQILQFRYESKHYNN